MTPSIKQLLCLVYFVSLCFSSMHVFAKPVTPAIFDKAAQNLENKVMAENEQGVLEQVAQVKTVNLWLDTAALTDDEKLFIGMQWAKKRYYPEAVVMLESADETKTDTDLWRYMYATVLVELQRVGDAKYQIVELEKSVGKVWEVELLKAQFLAVRGDISGAIEVMNKVVATHKKEGRAFFHRGFLLLVASLHDKAYADFMQAAKLLPKDKKELRQQAYFQAGLIKLRIHHDRKTAEGLFKKGMDIDPNSPLVEELRQAVK